MKAHIRLRYRLLGGLIIETGLSAENGSIVYQVPVIEKK